MLTFEAENVKEFVESEPRLSERSFLVEPVGVDDGSLPDVADPSFERIDVALTCQVRAPGRRAKLMLTAKERYRSGKTVLLVARSDNGLIEAASFYDPSRPRPFAFRISSRDLAGKRPSEVAPYLDFLSLFHQPNQFGIGMGKETPRWNPVPQARPPVDRRLAHLVLQLDLIAQTTGLDLRVPEQFTATLARDIEMAGQLIAGAIVLSRWESAGLLMPYEDVWAVDWENLKIDLPLPLKFDVGGQPVEIGRMARLRWARPVDTERRDDGVLVTLQPGDIDTVEYRRGAWLSPDERAAAYDTPAGAWVALIGEVVVATRPTRSELLAALRSMNVRADHILRSGASDMPAPT